MWHLPATSDGVNLKLAGITSKSWIASLFSTDQPKAGLASHPSRVPPKSSQQPTSPTTPPFQLRLCWSASSNAEPQPPPPLQPTPTPPATLTSTRLPAPTPETQASALRHLRLCLVTVGRHPPTPAAPVPAPNTAVTAAAATSTPVVEVVSPVFAAEAAAVVAVVGAGCLAVGVLGVAGLAAGAGVSGATAGGTGLKSEAGSRTVWQVVDLSGEPVRELKVVAVVERVVHILVVRQHAWEVVGLIVNGDLGSTSEKLSSPASTPLQRIAHGEAKEIGGHVLDLLKTGNSQYLLLFGGWPVLLASAGHSKVVDIRGGATAGCFIDEKHFLVCTHAPTGSQISVWAFTIQDGIKVKEKAAFDTPEKIVHVWNLGKDLFVFSDAQCRIGWVSKKDLLTSGPKLGWIPDVLGITECIWLDTERELQTAKPATNDANSKAFGILVRTDAGYLETVRIFLDKEGVHSIPIRDGVQAEKEWNSPPIPGVPRAKLWGIIRAPPLAFSWDNQSLVSMQGVSQLAWTSTPVIQTPPQSRQSGQPQSTNPKPSPTHPTASTLIHDYSSTSLSFTPWSQSLGPPEPRTQQSQVSTKHHIQQQQEQSLVPSCTSIAGGRCLLMEHTTQLLLEYRLTDGGWVTDGVHQLAEAGEKDVCLVAVAPAASGGVVAVVKGSFGFGVWLYWKTVVGTLVRCREVLLDREVGIGVGDGKGNGGVRVTSVAGVKVLDESRNFLLIEAYVSQDTKTQPAKSSSDSQLISILIEIKPDYKNPSLADWQFFVLEHMVISSWPNLPDGKLEKRRNKNLVHIVTLKHEEEQTHGTFLNVIVHKSFSASDLFKHLNGNRSLTLGGKEYEYSIPKFLLGNRSSWIPHASLNAQDSDHEESSMIWLFPAALPNPSGLVGIEVQPSGNNQGDYTMWNTPKIEIPQSQEDSTPRILKTFEMLLHPNSTSYNSAILAFSVSDNPDKKDKSLKRIFKLTCFSTLGQVIFSIGLTSFKFTQLQKIMNPSLLLPCYLRQDLSYSAVLLPTEAPNTYNLYTYSSSASTNSAAPSITHSSGLIRLGTDLTSQVYPVLMCENLLVCICDQKRLIAMTIGQTKVGPFGPERQLTSGGSFNLIPHSPSEGPWTPLWVGALSSFSTDATTTASVSQTDNTNNNNGTLTLGVLTPPNKLLMLRLSLASGVLSLLRVLVMPADTLAAPVRPPVCVRTCTAAVVVGWPGAAVVFDKVSGVWTRVGDGRYADGGGYAGGVAGGDGAGGNCDLGEDVRVL